MLVYGDILVIWQISVLRKLEIATDTMQLKPL